MSERDLLRRMFGAAVAAAQPALVLPQYLPSKPSGRTIVIGAGKASAAMARAFEDHWDAPIEGLVVTRYGHAVTCQRIEIVEAGHPVPDVAGAAAATRIMSQLQGLSPDDLVVALISGGGSALLAAPAPGITMEEKRQVTKALLASGASIVEMNCVRKHLSAVKGGRLAALAHPARVVTLAMSDVPGDDLSTIASGPTVPDATTCMDALRILDHFKIEAPPSVRLLLKSGKGETVKPGDPCLTRSETRCIASAQLSLEAVATVARAAGFAPLILGDAIEGEARDVAKVIAAIAMQVRRFSQPASPPCAIISGGETTVTVKGNGFGGRNVEFLLSAALQLNGASGIHALAADSDGIDGAREVAGAIITPDTIIRARSLGLDAQAMLVNNDAHTFFEKLGDQVVTGPTLTNVNDIRILLVR